MSIDEVRSFIHPDDLPDVVESAREALASNLPVDCETRYRHANGTWRYVLSRRVVERNAKGEAIANVCLCSRKDFRDSVVAARAAQSSWAGKSAYNRGQILYRLAEMLESRSSEIANSL
jgi:delta 1-pyrroline-5-carboxylate dehydrogenase